MKINDKVKFWQNKSKDCFKLANSLYQDKNYLWTLFFCQLTLEKALKALVIKVTKKEPPYTHDLNLLAQIAKLELSDDNLKELETFTGFNIETRYEDYKESLKKIANQKFTKNQLDLTKNYLKWFLNQD